jgi:predicted CopG family antitoxin
MATTIQITNITREKLKRFGHKGESYNDIINRLMGYFEELNMEKLIEQRWKNLQKEKQQYISLDEL